MNDNESQKSQQSLKVNERKMRSKLKIESQQTSQLSSSKNLHQNQSQQDNDETKNLVQKMVFPPSQNQENFDLSLNHLINNSSIDQQNAYQNQFTFPSLQQEEVLEFSNQLNPSQKLQQSDPLNSNMSKQISTSDVHSLLKNIKGDLQRVKEARQLMENVVSTYSQRSRLQDQQEVSQRSLQEGIMVPKGVQRKYNFLMKTSFHQTQDYLNSQVVKGLKKKMGRQEAYGGLELNNHIIREAYMLTKGREYVQLDLGNDDLQEGGESGSGEFLFNRRNKYNQSEQSIEITSVDIDMLTNDKRLHVSIPNYENHYRQYFENQDEFQENQELHQQERRVFNKIYHEKSDVDERKINMIVANMSECEKIDLLGKLLPEFDQCVKDLSVTRLKYNVLLDRIRKSGSLTFKQNIANDLLLQRLQVLQDIQKSENSAQNQPLNKQKTQNQGSSSASKKDKDGKKSQEEAKKELLQMKEQINQTESRLKEVQLQRLQEKVKGFTATERQLKGQIQEFEAKDESLVSKIEEAICFGKVMFSSRPIGAKDFSLLFNQTQMELQKIPNQMSKTPGIAQGQATQLQKQVSRINEALNGILEQEFDELFEELTNYRIQFQYKFALLNEENFSLFNDIHLMQESKKFAIENLTFIDLGIVVKNNKVNKKVYFFKIVNHNVVDQTREIYVMGIVEDQIHKWENSLDHSTEITLLDKTYKLIKAKLLKLKPNDNYLSNVSNHQIEEVEDDFQNTHDFPFDPLQQEILSSRSPSKYDKKPPTFLEDKDLNFDEKFLSEHEPPIDLHQIHNLEKQALEHNRQSNQQLQELGVNIENMQKTVDNKHFRDLSKIEDFGKVMSDVSMEVQKRSQQKQDQIMREERAKQMEVNRNNQIKEQVYREYAKSFKELELGRIFLKYGAMGQPKQKHVYLGDNGKKLCWKDPGVASLKKEKKYIIVKDIIDIKDGRQTKKFNRFKPTSDAQEKYSFSLITKKRTLDLESANIEDKQNFLMHLNKALELINDPNFFKKGGIRDQILQYAKSPTTQKQGGSRIFDSFLSGRKSPTIDNLSANQSHLK